MNPFVFKKINALLDTAKRDQEKFEAFGIKDPERISDEQFQAKIEQTLGHSLCWEKQTIFAGDGFIVSKLLCIGT